jgi:hypothetical protein
VLAIICLSTRFSVSSSGSVVADRTTKFSAISDSPTAVSKSTTILYLFVATLADYMLSAGFITGDLTSIKGRTEMMRTHHTVPNTNDLAAPL